MKQLIMFLSIVPVDVYRKLFTRSTEREYTECTETVMIMLSYPLLVGHPQKEASTGTF